MPILTPSQLTEAIRQRFATPVPLLLSDDTQSLKLELKPYLQPFERVLALRELHSLLGTETPFEEKNGYVAITTAKPPELLRKTLTYWQRVGCRVLEPTVQVMLELTQGGLAQTTAKRDLHNARRLRYGPHDLHEYRGKFFPQLVRSLMNIAGITDHALVLDPMCGSGTTPCEVLASGRSALAADLNPLSVLITSVKTALVLQDPSVFHDTVSSCLRAFRFRKVAPDAAWSAGDLKYLNMWFAAESLNDLAAILGDIASIERPLYRDFFRVCLSNVVRAVSWQKETDLRVRKQVKPYEPGATADLFRKEVDKQLDRIYPYLCVLSPVEPRPTCSVRHGDSVHLQALFPDHLGKADLLITSPPYATALPYIDTDRLSLVVLGLSARKQHKAIESMMVGTREISERYRRQAWDEYLLRKAELPTSVTSLINRVAEHNHGGNVGFRRRNLPTLLGKYFLTMLDAMRSALTLMKPGALAYYVVGNNSTMLSGERVEIPTDNLLFEVGAAAGWQTQETIPMELLASRDIFKDNRGSSETILCFSAKKPLVRKAIYTTEDVSSLIADGNEWNFHDADTQEHLHTLHPYPAKFIPQIPRKAIATWTAEGDLVYDPFCGCGTSLLEASLMGRPSVGTDNNSVAVLVSKAKTNQYTQRDLACIRAFGSALAEKMSGSTAGRELIPDNKNVPYWFSEEVMRSLAALRGCILAEPEPARTLLLAVFSSIIVRVSFQDSDTRYAKVKRTVKPSDVQRLFAAKLTDVLTTLPDAMLRRRSPVTVYHADARAVPLIASNSVSLVITSPPYLNAYDYHKYHRQRLHWIGGDVDFARDMEIGSHDEFTRPNSTPDSFFEDMNKCFSEWSRVLRYGGKCLVLIGDAIVNKQSVAVGDTFVDMMRSHDLPIEKRWIRTLHATKRAFNVDNSRITHEHVLLFSKHR